MSLFQMRHSGSELPWKKPTASGSLTQHCSKCSVVLALTNLFSPCTQSSLSLLTQHLVECKQGEEEKGEHAGCVRAQQQQLPASQRLATQYLASAQRGQPGSSTALQ